MINGKKVWLATKESHKSENGNRGDNKEIAEPKVVLLVENSFFEKAIIELLKHAGITVILPSNDFAERMDERENNLLSDIKSYVNSNNGFTHVLCIADANNARAQVQNTRIIESIRNAFADRNLLLTDSDIKKVNQCGKIIKKTGAPTIGIWIMPNNDAKGSFADFYLKSAKINSTLEHRLDDILQRNETEKLVKYAQNQQAKSIVKYLTLLAWQKEPMKATQSMFDENNFDNGTELYQNFNEWLKEFIKI